MQRLNDGIDIQSKDSVGNQTMMDKTEIRSYPWSIRTLSRRKTEFLYRQLHTFGIIKSIRRIMIRILKKCSWPVIELSDCRWSLFSAVPLGWRNRPAYRCRRGSPCYRHLPPGKGGWQRGEEQGKSPKLICLLCIAHTAPAFRMYVSLCSVEKPPSIWLHSMVIMLLSPSSWKGGPILRRETR